MIYEVDSDGIEEVALEFIFLNEERFTENLRSRHDFPTLLLPISNTLRLYSLHNKTVTSLPFLTFITINYEKNIYHIHIISFES